MCFHCSVGKVESQVLFNLQPFPNRITVFQLVGHWADGLDITDRQYVIIGNDGCFL